MSLNHIHKNSAIDTFQLVKNGPFHVKQSQVVVKPQTKKLYKIQPVITPAGTFIQSGNNYVDFKINNDIKGSVYDMALRFDITNANVANVTVLNSAVWWFDRFELRQGSQILETYRADEMWLNNTAYLSYEEMKRQNPYNLIDEDEYDISSDNVITASSTESYEVKVRTLLNSGVCLSNLTQELTLRVYSVAVATWCTDVNVSDLSISNMELCVSEVMPLNPEQLKPNRAYRFLAYKHEQASLSLTSGSTTKYITNNFNENELCSHMFVLVRVSGSTGANLETPVAANNVYLEDENNRNLNNGHQSTAAELKHEYLNSFNNNMASLKNIYLVYNNTEDPIADHRDNEMNGYEPLNRNFKVAINAAATATRQVDIYARVYKTVLVNNGVISYN